MNGNQQTSDAFRTGTGSCRRATKITESARGTSGVATREARLGRNVDVQRAARRAKRIIYGPSSRLKSAGVLLLLAILLGGFSQIAEAKSIEDEEVNCIDPECQLSKNLNLTVTTQAPSTTISDFLKSLFKQQATSPTPKQIPTTKSPRDSSGRKSDEEEPEDYGLDASEEEVDGDSSDEPTANQDDAGARSAPHDAKGCEGLSAASPKEGRNLTDHERLVNLQSCLQSKIRASIVSATRSGMEVFERLSLSGGCSASLMDLTSSLGGLKAFAFKFLDATAKMPSGMMYGLLSDFGDFDQCLSIRSDPRVALEDEAEERTYSGKYCLMSVKLNYHLDVEPGNSTAPDGIIPDGILWDELVRNYWTSKANKGFQVGMCFPSRCDNDDLDQLYKYVTSTYNVNGEILGCQDGLDVKRQATPDLVQKIIIHCFSMLLLFTLVGSLIDRYYQQKPPIRSSDEQDGKLAEFARGTLEMSIKTLLCFSVMRNWRTFMSHDNLGYWEFMASSNSRQSPSSGLSTEDLKSRETSPQFRSNLHSLGGQPTDIAQGSLLSCKTGPLLIKIQQPNSLARSVTLNSDGPLRHLAGLRLLIIIWITAGHSFLYPSANNYQYYRSIVNMKITRDSLWFAMTNFTLGIDSLLYITGLVFVYKLAQFGSSASSGRSARESESSPRSKSHLDSQLSLNRSGILRLLSRKILRFWPTYISVIAIAIVVPLASDGPMWPDMVGRRLGETCRRNWWANLLIVNNLFGQAEICLPSSWFVSVLMQLFLIGSIVMLLVRESFMKVAIAALVCLLTISCGTSFFMAYKMGLRAPVIRMDESFVMELDDNIFRLYTNVFNNLAPFVIGMIGGLIMVSSLQKQSRKRFSPSPSSSKQTIERLADQLSQVLIALTVLTVAVLVLSSVFHQDYTRFWSAFYWSFHRMGWAIVTGYLIHQCSTKRWKLLNDLLSLRNFVPLSKLIFIAYLVHPIFIHVHSGLVRDGLHVSIYNMLNIYITRLVMTFTLAALIHLLVELPFCSIEEIYLKKWVQWVNKPFEYSEGSSRDHPLLTVAPTIINYDRPDENVSLTANRDSAIDVEDDKICQDHREVQSDS